jgi:hypothetical protein
MKHNFIFEPSRNYHEQHMLPISPQNFDPLDKNREAVSQKKTIFSTSTKPKAAYDIIFESDNSQSKSDDFNVEAELKRMLFREMKLHFENLKAERVESFSVLLRDYRATGKVSNDELQEIKRQILYNKRKFEEIQENLGHLSQQYSEANSIYGKDADNYRTIGSFSTLSRNERQLESSPPGDMISQKQLDIQFKAHRQGLLAEVQNAIKVKGKSKLSEDTVGELKQIKYNFENDLKQNFEIINGRVKRAEENLNEIMRKKREHMEAIREEFVASMNHHEAAVNQEFNHIENVLKSKCDQNQAKAIVNNEINKRMELFKTEIDSLRKSLKENQEEMERVETIVNRKLENLDFDMKRQFVELQASNSQRGGVPQDLIERRLQKLNSDSETYHKTIQQLRTQVDEITKFHKTLQTQVVTPSSQSTILRLEEKIRGLQNHIIELETFVKRNNKTGSMSEVEAFTRTAPESNFTSYTKPQSNRASPDKNPYGMQTEDNVTYYGDPKIKSIIDEFQSKKKTQGSLETRKSPVHQQQQMDKPSFNEIPNKSEAMIKPQGVTMIQDAKKLKHAKILAQINYFINGTTSNFLDDEEDAEIYCNLDDDGYIFDEDGDFVLNAQGQKVKLTPEQIDRFNNNNMIE